MGPAEQIHDTHDMGHDHAHAVTPGFGARFALGISLNLGFVAIEALYGWRAGSLALLADAGHNLGDVGGLALAWAGLASVSLAANDRHTYGWQRASIVAGGLNATLLLLLMGALALEAAGRLASPAMPDEWPVLVVAAAGIALNGATAWLFFSGSHDDLNLRGAFVHMAADALVSLGVVIGAGVVLATGWTWIDPALSLLIAAVVVWGTWSLFAQSWHLLFDGVPRGVDLRALRASLLELPPVLSLHDLHVWALSTSRVALTAHLVLRPGAPSNDAILAQAAQMLHEAFRIDHVTLQLESREFAVHCALSTDSEPACPGTAALLGPPP